MLVFDSAEKNATVGSITTGPKGEILSMDANAGQYLSQVQKGSVAAAKMEFNSISLSAVKRNPELSATDPLAYLKTTHNTLSNMDELALPPGTVKKSGSFTIAVNLRDPADPRMDVKEVPEGTPGSVYINAETQTAMLKPEPAKLPDAPKKEWYESPMAMMAITAAIGLIGTSGQYFMGTASIKSQEKLARENRDLQLEMLGKQLAASQSGTGSGSSGTGFSIPGLRA